MMNMVAMQAPARLRRGAAMVGGLRRDRGRFAARLGT